jgi:S1-C subfamily serine protease
MRRALFLPVVLLSLAMSWPIDRLERSLGKLEIADGICTAFSIHQKRALFVTATHCLDASHVPTTTLNGGALVQIVEAIPGDSSLTVLKAAKGQPALRLGPPPLRGDEVLVLGFSTPPVLLFFEGLHMADTAEVDDTTVQVVTAPGLRGMSGGPIVDRKGRVVGVMMGGAQITPPVPTMVSFATHYQQLASIMAKYGEQ